jgi:hypothetical protein
MAFFGIGHPVLKFQGFEQAELCRMLPFYLRQGQAEAMQYPEQSD